MQNRPHVGRCPDRAVPSPRAVRWYKRISRFQIPHRCRVVRSAGAESVGFVETVCERQSGRCLEFFTRKGTNPLEDEREGQWLGHWVLRKIIVELRHGRKGLVGAHGRVQAPPISTNIGSFRAAGDSTGRRQIRESANRQFEIPLLEASQSPTAHEATACRRATMAG